ncbi:hypothetical protein QMZ30_14650 [Pantoea sp. EA-12]|uniref:hypothetical protein n=1 Tax=Pantoea sp. EA-12 TaxID=3043303 RepID=UPI0024B4A0AC|nr:hypothetical protein [Pantoea sp. EA-12]MDI9222142.1 hypothetical protein [Pantoea sp. EA-12]
MASVDDVSQYLAKRVADVLYPGGSLLPGIVNAPVKIYPGWPASLPLQSDIESGGAHVSVWPLPAERKVNCALGRSYQQLAKGMPTLKLWVTDCAIAVSGVASALTNVQVRLNGKKFIFHFRTGTTAEHVVNSLQQHLPHAFAMMGRVIISVVNQLSISVTTAGTAVRELRRQIKEFQVTVWAPSPQLRNTIGTAIDAVLSEHCHIDLGDGVPAQMFYARQFDSDAAENWHVYRRDLIFSVNFATTQTVSAPEVTDIAVNLNGHSFRP